MRERFAAALVAWRTKRGLGDPKRFPQGDAARELSVSLRTYQHWEAGEHMPRQWDAVGAICDIIGIDRQELLADNGTMPADPEPETPTPPDLQRKMDELNRRIAELEEQGSETLDLLRRLVAAQEAS